MYRRGPSKTTPAGVKCQKCLKHGHYSYECKASVQERPYIARPSRTQQLSNPKLIPKLTEATPPELQKKSGVADEQLAKLEAERARKKELDDETRSVSEDSVSTISTRGSPEPTVLGKGRMARSPSPRGTGQRSETYRSAGDRSLRGSRSPTGHSGRDVQRYHESRSPVSPQRSGGSDTAGRDKYEDAGSPGRYLSSGPPRRRSPSSSHSPPPDYRQRYRSRSPGNRDYSDSAHHGGGRKPAAALHDHRHNQNPSRYRQERRERSLSPFSKRKAMS